MPLNSLNASPKPPKRKNFSRREKSLPTYEQATDTVFQEAFLQSLATAPPLDSATQNQPLNNDKTINNIHNFNRTRTTQLSPRDQGLGRPLPNPAMVPYRNYRIWNTPSSENFTDLRPVEKKSMLGFHIVFYLIVIMIILLLIVFITKLMKWVSFY